MNVEKLAKQFRKELTRNPKKSAALGLITVVALWFWAPLVWKYGFGDGKAKPKGAKPAAAAPAQGAAAVPAPAPAGAATTTTQGGTAAKSIEIKWDELLKRMQNDDRMRTATLAAGRSDPFVLPRGVDDPEQVATTPEAPDAASPTVTASATEQTPESVGLTLEATLVSPRTKKAMISGRAYREGEKVSARPQDVDRSATDSPAAGVKPAARPVEFTVQEIDVRRVVLTRNTRTYELTILREGLTE